MPRWYVAVADGLVVGSVGLVPHDMSDRPDQRHRFPWVSDVFVSEGCRNRGVATAMMRHIAEEPTSNETLYLQTYSADSLYAALGWAVLERVMYHGELTAIMSKSRSR